VPALLSPVILDHVRSLRVIGFKPPLISTRTLTPDPDSQAQMQKEDVSFENIKRIATMMDDHDSVGVTRKLNGGKCVFAR
jgi:hypothetical protein